MRSMIPAAARYPDVDPEIDDPLRDVVALFRQRFAGRLSRSHGGTHP